VENLWEILTKGQEISNDGLLFKAKEPKKFIQVKTQKVNGGSEMIAIFSDITKIKELEG
jgi:hypothetical protein